MIFCGTYDDDELKKEWCSTVLYNIYIINLSTAMILRTKMIRFKGHIEPKYQWNKRLPKSLAGVFSSSSSFVTSY